MASNSFRNLLLLLLLNPNLAPDESRLFVSTRHVDTADFTLAWTGNLLIGKSHRSACPHEHCVARDTVFQSFDLADTIGRVETQSAEVFVLSHTDLGIRAQTVAAVGQTFVVLAQEPSHVADVAVRSDLTLW